MPLQNILSKIYSYFPEINKQTIRKEFKHAFSIKKSSEDEALNEKELAVVSKLITIIHKRRLTIPATLFLESVQPINYIGSQMMVFFRPFLTYFFTTAEYDAFQGLLEKRQGIKRIIEELEKIDIHCKDAKSIKED